MIPKIEAKAEVPQVSARMEMPRPQARMTGSGLYKTYRLLCGRCRRNPIQCNCAKPGKNLLQLVEVRRIYA